MKNNSESAHSRNSGIAHNRSTPAAQALLCQDPEYLEVQ